MGATAAYDEIADWYAEYTSRVGEFTDRVDCMLHRLLGEGSGRCVDLCCGTGAHASALGELGWQVVGIDLSREQLRHAVHRLPVACADAAALPIGSGRVEAVAAILCHTDVGDYAAVVREAARVLAPGGSFVHIGVHPCFAGAFADRSDVHRLIIDSGYHRRERRFDSFTDQGVRVRVGATHTPLPNLLHTALDAGLVIEQVTEAGPAGALPDIFGFSARKLAR